MGWPGPHSYSHSHNKAERFYNLAYTRFSFDLTMFIRTHVALNSFCYYQHLQQLYPRQYNFVYIWRQQKFFHFWCGQLVYNIKFLFIISLFVFSRYHFQFLFLIPTKNIFRHSFLWIKVLFLEDFHDKYPRIKDKLFPDLKQDFFCTFVGFSLILYSMYSKSPKTI